MKDLKGNCQHCGGVIAFPAEHAGESAPCPHCQQETTLLLAAPPEEKSPLRTRAIVFISIALVILIAGLVGTQLAIKRAKRMTGQTTKPVTTAVSATLLGGGVAQTNFLVSSVVLEKTSGSSLIYAVGTITEAANRKRFGVQVEIALFNREGKPCGVAKDYQANLDANGQWKFRALVIEKTAVSAEVTAIKEGH